MKKLLANILIKKAAMAIAIPVALAGMASGSYAVAKIAGAPTHRAIASADPSESVEPSDSIEPSDSPEPSDTPEPSKSPEEHHGGTVERFHGDGTTACALPDGTTLTGNWTHGDYVSAWAATGDRAATRAAAHSPCGKRVKKAHSHGKSGESHGKSGEPHGKSAEAHGKSGESHGNSGNDTSA
jgi:hypothetical protein